MGGPSGRVPQGPVEFNLESNEADITFECSLDSAAFAACASPYRIQSPAAGRHELRVRAIDSSGKSDATPVTRSWASVAPHLELCGPIAGARTLSPDEAQVYVLTCPVQVPTGAGLKAEAGTIIKSNAGAAIEVSGTLEAVGTGADPVVFTSHLDDSVGGDTGGDGPRVNGDPGTAALLRLEDGSTTDIKHAILRDAGRAVVGESCCSGPDPDDGTGVLKVFDSRFESGVEIWVDKIRAPVLERNTFDLSGQPAIWLRGKSSSEDTGRVDASGIDLSGSDANSFKGEGAGRAVSLSGAAVPATKTWRVSSDTGAVLYYRSTSCSGDTYCSGLLVNGTLVAEAGTIIKADHPVGVNTGGTLEAVGTGADPVVFTSHLDDSVGGDTGGDGPRVNGDPGTAALLRLEDGSTTDIKHAILRDAGRAVVGESCCSGPDPDDGTGVLKVFDSRFESGVEIWVDKIRAPVLERNTFDLSGQPAIWLRGKSSSEDTGRVDASGIDLSGSDANSFKGEGAGRAVSLSGAAVPATKTWRVSSDTGAVLYYRSTSCSGDTYCSGLLVNGTLVAEAGTIIKADHPVGVNTGGTLEAVGTGADPVVFTSHLDDSVGGDTGGDGPRVNGDPGTAALLRLEDGSTTDIKHAILRDAGTGIAQSGGILIADPVRLGTSALPLGVALAQTSGDAAIRGEVRVTTSGVQSCDWGALDCGVDAALVDWGASNGPNGLVCGQVVTSPYLDDGQPVTTASWSSNCGGSIAPPARLQTSQTNFAEGLSALEELCQDVGDHTACEGVERAQECIAGGATAAGADAPFPYEVPDEPDFAATFGDQMISAASDFLHQSREPAAQTSGRLIFIGNLGLTAVTLGRLAIAYDNCAP